MRLRHLLLAFLLTTVVMTTGCETMTPDDFKNNAPRFDLFEYFPGHTRAWGLFEDRFGKVRRQFTVDIRGRIEGETLILDEDFLYDDGERDRRVWTIRRDGGDAYTGRAEDVVGEARGHSAGNALRWTYQMELPVGDSTWRVVFDDWMFLQPDGVLINRAKVRKFGFEIGSVSLFFKKPAAPNGSASQEGR
jgi:hypothetical protein